MGTKCKGIFEVCAIAEVNNNVEFGLTNQSQNFSV